MIDRLEKMLADGRDDPMLRFGLGSAYFNKKDYDRAVAHLTVCIDQDENYSAAYKLLGKAYFSLEKNDLAMDVFEKGLVIAVAAGDKQSEKEMTVFLKKLQKKR